MANKIIHIYGASGSGTTTLAKHISEKLDYFFMDTDDYFWKPTNPPYKEKRNIFERLELMKKDIVKSNKVIISGSLVDWGDIICVVKQNMMNGKNYYNVNRLY